MILLGSNICRLRVMLSSEILDGARDQRRINHRLVILTIVSVKEDTARSIHFDDCVTLGRWPAILIQSGLYFKILTSCLSAISLYMLVFNHCVPDIRFLVAMICTRSRPYLVTSATPSLLFWKALLHNELTFSSNLSLALVQSAVCNVRTFFSSSAFQRSFAVSSRPVRTSRLMGSGCAGSGSTMPFSRTACWCRRALW